jgi:hypothetical protein
MAITRIFIYLSKVLSKVMEYNVAKSLIEVIVDGLLKVLKTKEKKI